MLTTIIIIASVVFLFSLLFKLVEAGIIERIMRIVDAFMVLVLKSLEAYRNSLKQLRDLLKQLLTPSLSLGGSLKVFLEKLLSPPPTTTFQWIVRIRSLLNKRFTSNPEHKRRVRQPPGATMLKVVEFLHNPKYVEETFKPIVADWRVEYFDALKEGRTVKARWISMRYRYSFIIAMGLSKLFSLLKNIKSTIR